VVVRAISAHVTVPDCAACHCRRSTEHLAAAAGRCVCPMTPTSGEQLLKHALSVSFQLRSSVRLGHGPQSRHAMSLRPFALRFVLLCCVVLCAVLCCAVLCWLQPCCHAAPGDRAQHERQEHLPQAGVATVYNSFFDHTCAFLDNAAACVAGLVQSWRRSSCDTLSDSILLLGPPCYAPLSLLAGGAAGDPAVSDADTSPHTSPSLRPTPDVTAGRWRCL
jgi:hypothetical protein